MELLFGTAGVFASAFFSWLITHMYYRKALTSQSAAADVQIKNLAALVEQGKDSAHLRRELLRQERIEQCRIEHQRAGTPTGLIDTYSDLTIEERADLLDVVFMRIKGRKPKVNKYRAEKPST